MNMTHLTVPNFKFISYGIQCDTNSQGGQYNFLLNQYLKEGARIYGIQVFTSNDITYDPTAPNFKVADADMIKKFALTLYMMPPKGSKIDGMGDAGEWLKQIPLTALHCNFNTNSGSNGSSVVEKFITNGYEVDFNKSYIKAVEDVVFTEKTSFLFGINYMR